jgi:hypothetical protein
MADLTTLENVKSYMQITDTSQDIVLARLISAFSQWFLTQVNRGALISSTYTEQRNGQGGDSLTTIYWPIQSITSLTVDGITIPASVNGSPGYVFDSFTIWLTTGYSLTSGFSSCFDARFRRGRGNVQILYVAGYTNVPLDIEQAVIDQVAFTLRRQPNLGTTSQSMNGITTVSFSQKDLAPGVQAVVEFYRDRAVVGL